MMNIAKYSEGEIFMHREISGVFRKILYSYYDNEIVYYMIRPIGMTYVSPPLVPAKRALRSETLLHSYGTLLVSDHPGSRLNDVPPSPIEETNLDKYYREYR